MSMATLPCVSAALDTHARKSAAVAHDDGTFLSMGLRTGTDKVAAVNGAAFEVMKDARNPACRVWGHFYH